jgi:hypothetical protein
MDEETLQLLIEAKHVVTSYIGLTTDITKTPNSELVNLEKRLQDAINKEIQIDLKSNRYCDIIDE